MIRVGAVDQSQRLVDRKARGAMAESQVGLVPKGSFIRASKVDEFRMFAEQKVKRLSQDSPRVQPKILSGAEFTLNKLNLSELEVYGREKEITQLKKSFQDVIDKQNKSVISIVGYSGVGKSLLALQLRPMVLEKQGFFCVGKFDQQNRAEPYKAFANAFSELVEQCLARDESFVANLKEKLKELVKSDGKLLCSIVPELQKLFGDAMDNARESTVAVEMLEGRINQVQLAFQRLVRVLSQPSHPLVMVIDDVQWIDQPSLHLLDAIGTDPRAKCLLLLTTARESEMDDENHPFIKKLHDMQEEGILVDRIHVENLDLDATNMIVSTALRSTLDFTLPLAEIVHARTLGNAFFVVQFLQSLLDQGLLSYIFGPNVWSWDLECIRSLEATDNVAQLMMKKMKQSGRQSEVMMQVAACLGQSFEEDTLMMILKNQDLEEETRSMDGDIKRGDVSFKDSTAVLRASINQGLLEQHGSTISFVHDQIQTAALSLDVDGQSPKRMVRIGQYLLSQAVGAVREHHLLLAVDLCNNGRSFLDKDEHRKLAGYNLEAGQAAMQKGSFAVALKYFECGLSCLGDAYWSRHEHLALELTNKAAQAAAYCGGQEDRMDEHLVSVISQDMPLENKMEAYFMKIRSLGMREKFEEAITVGIQVLKSMGIHIPSRPSPVSALIELNKTKKAFKNHTLSSLSNLPVLEDERHIFELCVLSSLLPPSYSVSSNLLLLVCCRGTRKSLEYGVCKFFPGFVSAFGMICRALGKSKEASMYAQVALTIGERPCFKEVLPSVILIVYALIHHWQNDLRSIEKPLWYGYQEGIRLGDIEYSLHCLAWHDQSLFVTGARSLDVLVPEMEEHINTFKLCQHKWNFLTQFLVLQMCRNLQGASKDPTSLLGKEINGEELLEMSGRANMTVVHQFALSYKMQLMYLFGHYEESGYYAQQTLDFGVKTGIGGPNIPRHFFFRGLVAVALANSRRHCLGWSAGRKSLRTARQAIRSLEKWTQEGSADCLHMTDLLKAEMAAIHTKPHTITTAAELYKIAIRNANRGFFVNDTALAHERAGLFYLENGNDDSYYWASYHIDCAIQCYRSWGAKAKVHQLMENHKAILNNGAGTNT